MRKNIIFALLLIALVLFFVTTLTGVILDFIFMTLAVLCVVAAIAITGYGLVRKKQ